MCEAAPVGGIENFGKIESARARKLAIIVIMIMIIMIISAKVEHHIREFQILD